MLKAYIAITLTMWVCGTDLEPYTGVCFSALLGCGLIDIILAFHNWDATK